MKNGYFNDKKNDFKRQDVIIIIIIMETLFAYYNSCYFNIAINF